MFSMSNMCMDMDNWTVCITHSMLCENGWFFFFYLLYRDLKVSNLLMTDKGCVKIGELSFFDYIWIEEY